MRRLAAHLAVLLALAALVGAAVPASAADTDAAAAAADTDAAVPAVDTDAADAVVRVVVVSIPTLTWELVAEEQPPALTGLLSRSAVASASVRTIGATTSAGEGYATIGAGNRVAVIEELAGSAFAPTTEVDGEVAEAILARRGGAAGDAAVVHLGLPAFTTVNDRLLYGAEPGALGSALTRAGLEAGVVGNADLEADVDLALEPLRARREVALGLADADGAVPLGEVGPVLLQADPEAPFGARLDPEAVSDAFDDALATADVVLVELSDLARADAFRPYAGPEAATAARSQALADTDELLAALLDSIDLGRDLVLLVAPTAPRGPPQLVVAAMAGPGVEPGLALSGTTGRAGFVTLPDVAPTVLAHLDIDQPGAMNGAPISSAGGDVPDAGTWRARAADNERALFRNAASGPLTVVFIVLLIVSLALAAFALTARRPGLRRAASFLQLVALAVPLVTYLAGLVRDDRLGVAGSVAATLLVAAVVAAGARLVGVAVAGSDRATVAFAPPILLLSLTAVVLLLDVFVGAPLQLDTAFGYGGGAIVAGRFTGYGNLAGGLLTLSVIGAATGAWGLLEVRRGGDGRPSRLAVALIALAFGFTVVVTGLPGLGRDVGGILAIVPGFAVVLALLTGIRLTWQRLALLGVATVAVLGAFGAIDLLRPPERRGHLGRLLAQTFGDQGTAGFLTVIERKVNANLTILVSSVWSVVIPVAIAFIAFLIWRPPRAMSSLLRLPGVRAFLIGSLATCALAAVLNDSGIAIPGIMLTLLLPYVAHLALELPAVPDQPAGR